MAAVTVGGVTAAPLQTSWTPAEAACAARHRGDTYFPLTHPDPASKTTTVSDAAAPTGAKSPDTSELGIAASHGSGSSDARPPGETAGLAPGFTLHL
jgi:hypothetical protein